MILSNEHAFNNRQNFKRSKYNLFSGERKVLYDLIQNKDIAIKSEEKGNAVCVLQYEDYISEGLRQRPFDTGVVLFKK